MDKSIMNLFPAKDREFWKRVVEKSDSLREIRLRVNCPVVVHMQGGSFFLTAEGSFTLNQNLAVSVSYVQLSEMIAQICQDSLYAYEDELRQGFLTVAGGHRVGVAGQAVLDSQGKLKTIKNISFINIRISHQIPGVADELLPFVYRNQRLKNTLIISPPGCGKTTVLRDLIRLISNGNNYGKAMNVAVVDERSEIAGSYCGVPQNDVGIHTDVLDGCPKEVGMMLLLRSMSPQVIAIDELGSQKEIEALKCACACGCFVLATVHGESLTDVENRFDFERDCIRKMFHCFIVLGKEDNHYIVKQIKECQG